MRQEYEEILDVIYKIYINEEVDFCSSLFNERGDFNFVKEDEKGLELYSIEVENEEEELLIERRKLFIPHNSIGYIEYKKIEEILTTVPDLIYNHITNTLMKEG